VRAVAFLAAPSLHASQNGHTADPLLSVRVSRPYYYLVTLWLYLMPTGGQYELLGQPNFWLGAAYCTVPLNLVCYLMNDLSDVKVDRHNPRKGGALLGAKETAQTLRKLVVGAALLQVPFVAAFAWLCGAASILMWWAAVIAVNWAYNFGPRLSARFVLLDLLCPCGYILVVPLACWLNALPYPPARSWAHATLLVVRTQLWIQTFDLEPDRAAGRRTTAVRLGLRGSQLALAVLLVAENIFVDTHFAHSWPLRSFSLLSLMMLAISTLPAVLHGDASDAKSDSVETARARAANAHEGTLVSQLEIRTRSRARVDAGASSEVASAGLRRRSRSPSPRSTIRDGSATAGHSASRAASMSPAAINATFLVLGLGGAGLMARVWLDAAFL